jgi:hypothetical protein
MWRDGNLGDGRAGPFRLEHDCALLLVAKAAAMSASRWGRIGRWSRCQDTSRLRVLSTIASTSAYSRADARMNTRSPIDLQRVRVESGAPHTQAIQRDTVSVRVLFGRQTTPVQRLNVHRPERLCGFGAIVARQRFSRSLAPFPCFLSLLLHLAESLSPAVKCALAQLMAATIFGTTDAAATPCFNMHLPVRPARAVLEFPLEPRLHRCSSSMLRRSSTWSAIAHESKRASPGRFRRLRRRIRTAR